MAVCNVVLTVLLALAAGFRPSSASLQLMDEFRGTTAFGRDAAVFSEQLEEEHLSVAQVEAELAAVRRERAAGNPTLDGDHTFGDGYPTARVHYSGEDSTVIFVLTYQQSNGITQRSNLYRSEDYGHTFVNINSRLDSRSTVVLSPNFFISDFNQNLLVFAHATQSRLYYTVNEGGNFKIWDITDVNINPRSILYHPDQDGWMMALDNNRALYTCRNFEQPWSKVDDNVAFYQWADPLWDDHPLRIYYTTFEPDNSEVTVNLFIADPPYTVHTQFDPALGSHDGFRLRGPYIFAQRTDNGKVNLYVSHMRKPFRLAKIPTPYNHQNYIVNSIDELQAMVVIEHEGGFYNLYLSDSQGVDYSLSLRDIVVERGIAMDLEVIEGVNGTLIANQFVRDDPSQTNSPVRTLISLDNGGAWELIIPPYLDVDGDPLNCEPPSCSLHLHMDTSDYARLGVYSTSAAPGLIIAHGTASETLSDDPDLYISRDGGINWEQTLRDSWGVGVADHGGLLVAAKDYHQRDRSSVLKYSCDEGFTWNEFHFSSSSLIIWGVVTEPGGHTTVISLFGITNSRQWRVFTIDFRSIFERDCGDDDYELWMPWDLRSDTDCILGVTVTIERRRARRCCLNGRDYDREISIDICKCNGEDFECDYGYARDELTGPCERDTDVSLPDPCAEGKPNYTVSSGYRKVAGDLCQGGEEKIFAHYTLQCCKDGTAATSATTHKTPTPSTEAQKQSSSSNTGALVGTGVVIAILAVFCVVVIIVLVIFVLRFTSLRKRYVRLLMSGEGSRQQQQQRFAFHSDRESSMEPLTPGNETIQETEDDDPLIP